MNARNYRQQAEREHAEAASLRKEARRTQQDVATYTKSGDFDHARSSQDSAAKLEERAIDHERQAVEYEQLAIKLEREASALEEQLSRDKVDHERHVHDIELRIRQLLG